MKVYKEIFIEEFLRGWKQFWSPHTIFKNFISDMKRVWSSRSSD